MFTLRCTDSLLKHLRVAPEARPSPSTTKLGDWYAHLTATSGRRVILCVSEKTLLPVVLDVTSEAKLPGALGIALREVLAGMGVPEPLIDQELSEMDVSAFSRTSSQSVLGSMSDFAYMMQAPASDPESLTSLSLWLAETPCKPLKMGRPKDAVASVFGG